MVGRRKKATESEQSTGPVADLADGLEGEDLSPGKVQPEVDGDSPEAEQFAESGEEGLELLLEDARTKADEHWDRCLRLQAELDNLQKRSRRDLENAHKYGLEKLSAELLAVRDSLEMGLAAADQENIDPGKLKEGTELTLRMLTTAMEKFEIKEVDPDGQPFNPEFHQAISVQERSDVPPNTVITVVQKGYLLNDRLLRPAMVIVSRTVPEQDDSK